MLIYLLVFFISAFLFKISSEKKNKWNFWGILAILIPSILAALRDVSVGTDSETYYSAYTMCVEAQYTRSLNIEISFFLLSKLSLWLGGFPTLLFLYELLSIVFVYLAAMRLKSHVPVWLVMLLYFFLFYNISYNITRQVLAVAFVSYTVLCLFDGKIFRFLILSLIAVLMHTSAIVGCAYFLLIYWIVNLHSYKRRIVIVLLIVTLFVQYNYFILIAQSILSVFNIVKQDAYIGYLVNAGRQEISAVDISFCLFKLAFIAIAYYYRLFSRNILLGGILIAFCELEFLLLSQYNVWIGRLSYYFSISFIYFIPAICVAKRIERVSRQILMSFVVIIGCFYWIWVFVYRGSHATVPYKLGNLF